MYKIIILYSFVIINIHIHFINIKQYRTNNLANQLNTQIKHMKMFDYQ